MMKQEQSSWTFNGTPEEEEIYYKALGNGVMRQILGAWGDHPMSKKNARRLRRKIFKIQARIDNGLVLSEKENLQFDELRSRFADVCFSNPRFRFSAIIGAFRTGNHTLANYLIFKSMRMRSCNVHEYKDEFM